MLWGQNSIYVEEIREFRKYSDIYIFDLNISTKGKIHDSTLRWS